jgi:hypothetical protein
MAAGAHFIADIADVRTNISIRGIEIQTRIIVDVSVLLMGPTLESEPSTHQDQKCHKQPPCFSQIFPPPLRVAVQHLSFRQPSF